MNLYNTTFHAMGTRCATQLYAATPAIAARATAAVQADVERLEARYSRYRDNSFLGQINRVAAAGGSSGCRICGWMWMV